ncbi:MAG TPA: hypothetical protein VGG13_03850 [Candidatus Saccharimonadales bacterium]|jgi:hypothetical protein
MDVWRALDGVVADARARDESTLDAYLVVTMMELGHAGIASVLETTRLN